MNPSPLAQPPLQRMKGQKVGLPKLRSHLCVKNAGSPRKCDLLAAAVGRLNLNSEVDASQQSCAEAAGAHVISVPTAIRSAAFCIMGISSHQAPHFQTNSLYSCAWRH